MIYRISEAPGIFAKVLREIVNLSVLNLIQKLQMVAPIFAFLFILVLMINRRLLF